LHSEDRLLVTGFLSARDDLSFRSLYRAHTPFLYLFALRILGYNSGDAEDAVQETWIRAVEGIAEFRWRSSLRTWLAGIALNCCREIKRRSPQVMVDLSGVPGSAQNYRFTSDVERCVARLPDGCREVLVLHDIEGYTHKEIAESLQISEGTSKSQLFRAREKMRGMLKSFKEIS